MTDLLDTAEKSEPISQEVKSYIEANIHILQEARLASRNEATLEDIFKGRNPYYLRSTRKVAFQLTSYCLNYYLLSADEILFAKFSRELSAIAARRGQQMLEPASILEFFAQDDLPLEIELLNAYSRASNRLLYELYTEFCDDDANIDWEQLTSYICSLKRQDHSRESDNNSA